MQDFNERLIKMPELRKMVGKGRTSIYEAVNEGFFPRPVKIGSRAVAWRLTEIQKWIEERPRAKKENLNSSLRKQETLHPLA